MTPLPSGRTYINFEPQPPGKTAQGTQATPITIVPWPWRSSSGGCKEQLAAGWLNGSWCEVLVDIGRPCGVVGGPGNLVGSSESSGLVWVALSVVVVTGACSLVGVTTDR